MVNKLLGGVLMLFASDALALQPDLTEMGHQFGAKGVEIIWQAPTEQLPKKLTVSRIKPRHLSLEVISNLVTLARFNKPEEAFTALRPAANGRQARFQEDKPLRGVLINPESGYISVANSGAEALPREPVHGVPKKDELLALALALMSKLDINPLELARKPGTDEFHLAHILGEQGSFDKEARKVVKRTVKQGIILARAVDGIAFNGRGSCGGVTVCYGNNHMITSLEVVWPRLEAERSVGVVNKDQLLQWIKEGKAVIDEGVEANQIRKLTITQIVPCYLGKHPLEDQKIVYPYAEMAAKADLGGSNAVVRLSCPIFE
jgi:hypothetical protein